MRITSLAERSESLAVARDTALILLLNAALYWLGYLILGGSVLFAEGYEGESWIAPLHGDKLRVSGAIGWYSILHGISVMATLPFLPFCGLGILYQWAQLQRLRAKA